MKYFIILAIDRQNTRLLNLKSNKEKNKKNKKFTNNRNYVYKYKI
jgi:hypothetical protein